MMNATNHLSYLMKATLAFGCCAALVFGVALVTAQSKTGQSNSSNSEKRQHATSLRSIESPEGSRVAIRSDQSLSDLYEAYRRDDRFYLRIPASELPGAEALHGRAFGDVRVQRGADSTVISFRLQPGVIAHVEQRANELDVVFIIPGASRVTSAGSNLKSREGSHPSPGSNSNKTQAKSNAASPKTPDANANASSKSASANVKGATPAKSPEKPGSKPGTESGQKTVASSAPTPSPAASPKVTLAQNATAKPSVSSGIQSTPATTATVSETTATSWQSKLKERTRYWILLAQLNPIPVVIGALLLALVIVLLLFRRGRARATRVVQASGAELKKTKSANAPPSAEPTTESRAETIAEVAVPTNVVAAGVATSVVEEAKPAVRAATLLTAPDSARQARVATVADQVKNVMSGGEYDPGVIGSSDRETRQLVGAELLSAMVGRNLQRRDLARAAFMNHGYFDDATRDLRIADAPVERAAAARRLSFAHDREATPHLIAALDDSAPEVRRTAVEALMDLRDPAAIGPLNSLMQTESDRKVPRTLIKHAIDACATGTPNDNSASSDFSATTPVPQFSPLPPEPEREVIEL
jgi:hypothetical protein